MKRESKYLAALAICGCLPLAALTPKENEEVVLSACQAIEKHFYDETFRGLNWSAVIQEYVKKGREAKTGEALQAVIYEVFRKLNNSHSGFSNSEERKLRAAQLRIPMERTNGRLFVSYLPPSLRESGLAFGDEIIAIDGVPAIRVNLPVKRFHDSVRGNPVYGVAGSVANIDIERSGARRRVAIPRQPGTEKQDAWELKRLRDGIGYLRLNALGGADIPPANFRSIFEQANQYSALVLDLRDCPGGDLNASLVLASILFGGGKTFYTIRPRQRGPERVYSSNPPRVDEIQTDIQSGIPVVLKTYQESVRYERPTVLLINERTASEPENIVAAFKYYRRGIVIGTATEGATNGWSLGAPLPHKFGAVAVPYTRTVMADGRDYEGVSLRPDIEIRNTVQQLGKGNDGVLAKAVARLQAVMR